MRVQFDVDGCLADFMKGASLVAQEFDKTVKLVDTMTTRDWDHWEGWSLDTVAKTWHEIKTRPYFYLSLDSLISEGDWIRLKRWLSVPTHEGYFVTARPGLEAKVQTEEWLYDHLGRETTVVVCANKAGFAQVVQPNYCIEDNAENAAKIGRILAPENSFLIDRLYNQALHPKSATRIKNFSEFLTVIGA